MEAISTTTVQSLVNLALTKAQAPGADSGVEEGVIGHTPAGKQIACGVYWYTSDRRQGGKSAHIEAIEYEPAPDAVINDFDHFPEDLQDALWDVEEELARQGLTVDDVIRESEVRYSSPDVRANWKGDRTNARHCYWFADVKALTSYIREEYC